MDPLPIGPPNMYINTGHGTYSLTQQQILFSQRFWQRSIRLPWRIFPVYIHCTKILIAYQFNLSGEQYCTLANKNSQNGNMKKKKKKNMQTKQHRVTYVWYPVVRCITSQIH